MRLFVIAVVLGGASSALAQAQLLDTSVRTPTVMAEASTRGQSPQQTSPPAAAPGNVKTADPAPNTPIATLQGVCATRPAKGTCETVITREDLDRFATAFAPNLSEDARARLAIQYAGALAFSTLAEQQGLERNPVLAKELEEQTKLFRVRFLAGAFLQNLQQRTGSISEAEIQRYYDLHEAQYQQAQVIRVSVPISAPSESGARLDRPAIKAEMEELRTKAMAGGDLAQLQQDAFKHLHIQAEPPPLTPMTLWQRSVQGEEARAFDLKPGEMSAVLDLPASYAVLKLESKDAVPISAVRPEIQAALLQERMQDAIHKLGKDINAQFDLQYLGLTSQPDILALTATSSNTSRASLRRTSRARSGPGSTHWAASR